MTKVCKHLCLVVMLLLCSLHGSGPTCNLPVDHSEVAGGSKVDMLSASGGTLSTVEE